MKIRVFALIVFVVFSSGSSFSLGVLESRVDRLVQLNIDRSIISRNVYDSDSLREVMEELYFSETGKLFSMISNDERRKTSMSYIGETNYELLKDKCLKQIDGDGPLDRVSAYTFLSSVLFCDDYPDDRIDELFRLSSFEQEEFICSFGYVDSESTFENILIRYLCSQSVISLEDVSVTPNVTQEILQERAERISIKKQRRYVQSLRYANCIGLEKWCEVAGCGDDSIIQVEVLKDLYRYGDEFDKVVSVAKDTAGKNQLSSEDRLLAKWAFMMIGSRSYMYKDSMECINALRKISRMDDLVCTSAFDALSAVTEIKDEERAAFDEHRHGLIEKEKRRVLSKFEVEGANGKMEIN
ncbi:MAG: hypothetical protein JXR23_06525 [Pontiellaceae bacterium]|nr:hypothetical protein [Pontiellaceae bacterium]